jgi:hypothetical protein
MANKKGFSNKDWAELVNGQTKLIEELRGEIERSSQRAWDDKEAETVRWRTIAEDKDSLMAEMGARIGDLVARVEHQEKTIENLNRLLDAVLRIGGNLLHHVQPHTMQENANEGNILEVQKP